MNIECEPAYAIIRSDDFLGNDCPSEEKVTVKLIVRTREEATREVDRLNAIGTEGVRYFSQVTRLLPQPAAAASTVAPPAPEQRQSARQPPRSSESRPTFRITSASDVGRTNVPDVQTMHVNLWLVSMSASAELAETR